MDNRPIGVFDSGLGGLTGVRELRKRLPHEEIIYFGDTGRVPYGSRSPETILQYARQDVAFLLSKNVKCIMAACGTVSSNVLPDLQRESDLPILGVVEPACRKALAVTRNKRVGLIATAASVRSGAYERTIAAMDGGVTVIARACPLFVPLVENSRYRVGDCVVETVAREYLEPLKAEGIDTLILGCTHYPLLRSTLRRLMGEDVTLVNPAYETAIELRDLLQKYGLSCDEENTGGEKYQFFVSDQTEKFTAFATSILPNDVKETRKVDIEKY